MMRSREQHLEWCKQRAREYLKTGDIHNAISSMLSDLSKHPETKLSNPFLPMVGMLAARDNDLPAAERFIEGFR
jgi:hypothetical protein